MTTRVSTYKFIVINFLLCKVLDIVINVDLFVDTHNNYFQGHKVSIIIINYLIIYSFTKYEQNLYTLIIQIVSIAFYVVLRWWCYCG